MLFQLKQQKIKILAFDIVNTYSLPLEPKLIDTVLLYGVRGYGKRSGYYSAYTLGVRTEGGFVPIAKAYSGLTNAEIKEVSTFIKKNSIEKFGPVRSVKAELVFEIEFEGIRRSNRHKSGIALRFPRIRRWRKDKTVNDIDHLQTLLNMLDP